MSVVLVTRGTVLDDDVDVLEVPRVVDVVVLDSGAVVLLEVEMLDGGRVVEVVVVDGRRVVGVVGVVAGAWGTAGTYCTWGRGSGRTSTYVPAAAMNTAAIASVDRRTAVSRANARLNARPL